MEQSPKDKFRKFQQDLDNGVCPECGCANQTKVNLVNKGDEELFVKVCSDCSYSFGFDDSVDPVELRRILEKHGVIRTSLAPCSVCRNQNIDRFIYMGPDDAGKESIQCMECSTRSGVNIIPSYFNDADCDRHSAISSDSGWNSNEEEANSSGGKLNGDVDPELTLLGSYLFCENCQNDRPECWSEVGNGIVRCLKCKTKFCIPESYLNIENDHSPVEPRPIIRKETVTKDSSRDSIPDYVEKTTKSKFSSGYKDRKEACHSSSRNILVNPDVAISESFNCAKTKSDFENVVAETKFEQSHSSKPSPTPNRIQRKDKARPEPALSRTTSSCSLAGSPIEPVSSKRNSLVSQAASGDAIRVRAKDSTTESLNFEKTRSVFEDGLKKDNRRQVLNQKLKPAAAVPKSTLDRSSRSRTKLESCNTQQVTAIMLCRSQSQVAVPKISSNSDYKTSTRPLKLGKHEQSVPRPMNEKRVPRPTNERRVPRPMNEQSVLRPTNEQTVPRPMNEQRVPRPTNERRLPRPMNEQSVPRPTNEQTVPRPMYEQRVPRQTNERRLPQPMNEQSVPRPMNEQTVPRPANGKLGKTRITTLDMLKQGDHICWHRDYIVYHHAIVDEINENSLTAFENTGHVIPVNGKFARIEKNRYEFSKRGDMLYRFDYDECDSLSVEETMERANSRIDEARYNFFTNNCEHFATWCKTGKARSGQVGTFVGRLCLIASEISAKVGEEGLKFGTKILAQGAQSLNMIKEVGLQNGLKIMEGAAMGSINGGMMALGIAINLAFDVGSFAYHTYKAHRRFKNNEISHDEFKRTRMKIGGECLGRFIFSTALGIAGNFICPVIGGVIGATLGGFIGRLVGAALGKKLAEYVYRKN